MTMTIPRIADQQQEQMIMATNTTSAMMNKNKTEAAETIKETILTREQTNEISLSSSIVVSRIYSVPEIPDKSIGKLLREIIPADDAKNKSFPLSSCSPTSQYKIVVMTTTMSNRTQESDKQYNQTKKYLEIWKVESYDELGQRKTNGGDEFQISFSHNGIATKNNNKKFTMSAIAIAKDHNDGTYSLEFWTPSLSPDYCIVNTCSSSGTLKFDMIYTCSIGRMTRPSKDQWKHGGYLYGKTYFVYNITAPKSILKFEGPTKHLQQLDDLAQFDKVICFGDSLLGNMCGYWWNKYIFKKLNIDVQGNFGSSIRPDLLLNETFPLLEKMHGKDLRQNNVSTAIILGSAAWEMSANLGPYPGHFFNNTLAMYQDLVVGVRERYPNVSVFWKSPQAVHLTALQDDCYDGPRRFACINRVRYISNSIAQYLYEEQKRIMNKLNVPFLDVFDATYLAESWHMDQDCQHYRHWLNMRLLDYFHSGSTTIISLKRRLQHVRMESTSSNADDYTTNQYSSKSSPWWDINFL